MADTDRDRRLARWERIRADGRLRYVLRYGMLGWGVTTGLVWAGLMSLIGSAPSPWLYIALGLSLFPLAGVLWGMAMWNWMERHWRRQQPQDAG